MKKEDFIHVGVIAMVFILGSLVYDLYAYNETKKIEQENAELIEYIDTLSMNQYCTFKTSNELKLYNEFKREEFVIEAMNKVKNNNERIECLKVCK